MRCVSIRCLKRKAPATTRVACLSWSIFELNLCFGSTVTGQEYQTAGCLSFKNISSTHQSESQVFVVEAFALSSLYNFSPSPFDFLKSSRLSLAWSSSV
uniref:Putative secreted protein n=1 Tax=Ixodes ricinus TaxID=34613 RepID=A0A6B0UFK7_IXORI